MSVVVPVYNVKKYLHRTVNSLLNQTLKDIEVILVDDGSNDGSEVICKEYAKQDSRVKYIRQENDQAPGKARNEGLKLVQSEAVIFFDSDDWMEPWALERMYNLLISSELDMVLCGVRVFSEERNQPITSLFDSFFTQTSYSMKQMFNAQPFPCNKLYRTQFLLATGVQFLEKIFTQDAGFYFSVLMHKPKYGVINEKLVYYLVRPGSITTNTKTKKKHIDILKVFDQVYDEMEKMEQKAEVGSYIDGLLIKTMIYKSTFFDPKTDREYLDQLIEYLKTRVPNWEKNEVMHSEMSFIQRVYIYLLFNHYYWVMNLYRVITSKVRRK